MLRKDRFGAITSAQDRTLRVVFSDESIDDTGDVVVQSGISLRRYVRNNIVLLGHDPMRAAGLGTDIRLDALGSTCLITLAPAGVSPEVDTAWGLIQEGILKAISWGFDPLEMEPMDPARPRGPQRYLRSLMREISIVSLPANCNANILNASNAKDISDLTRAQRIARAVEYQRESRRDLAEQFATGNTIEDDSRPLCRAERIARAAQLVARGEALGAVAPAPMTLREAEIQGQVNHSGFVMALQKAKHPDRASRMARAAKLNPRPAGY